LGNNIDCAAGISAMCALPRDSRLGRGHQPI